MSNRAYAGGLCRLDDMGRAPPPERSTAGNELLSLLVHAGVAYFGKRLLADPSPTFLDSHHEFALANTVGRPEANWEEVVATLGWGRLPFADPLAQLVEDYNLCPADIFLLGLCGEVENSHWLNMALAELQAPDTSPRPSVHLLCRLLAELFGGNRQALDIARHPLVAAGVLQVPGDEPWPLRKLQIEPQLWQLFTGVRGPWPGVTFFPPVEHHLIPDAVAAQLPRIAQQIRLDMARGVVLRGNRETGAIVAAELAGYLNRRPADISREDWRNGTFDLAARYDNWLPVICLALGPAESFDIDNPRGLPYVVLAGREGVVRADGLIELEVPAPGFIQRRKLWQQLLPSSALACEVARAALLDATAIARLAATAGRDAARAGEAVARRHLVKARLQTQGSQLRQLAQPVYRQVNKDALVLPAVVERQMQYLLQRCCKRELMWEGLGASAQASVNLGVRALFCGESGTGKTLAASFVATQLGAPLFRLDLAAVMNKYVGETEKNLGLLLEEAAASDIVLLMDEADALFGKRTEATGAGDRFANMLTNYLLSRIETHPGVVILTSNARSRIDAAFTRRLDSIIEFPSPGVRERCLLWEKHLGARSPGLEFCQLLASFCELPGGFIRNAVLNAAVMSDAENGTPIPASILLQSLMEEYRKIGRAVPSKLEQLNEKMVQKK